jgi:hypothetical protein
MDDMESIFTETGILANSCPYCGSNLAKRPTRKTKCPNCGEFIYVRTRPIDRQKVLLTHKDAELIDKQRHVTAGINDAFVYDEKVIEETRKNLSKALKRTPSDFDVKAEICRQQQSLHSSEWDWGLYRNARFEIAEFQRAAGRIRNALAIYWEVSYLDLNGPNNVGGIRKWPDLLKEHPPFKPKAQGLAPGVVERLVSIVSFLGFDIIQMETQFLAIAARVHDKIGTPLTPSEAWIQLKSQLSVNGLAK